MLLLIGTLTFAAAPPFQDCMIAGTDQAPFIACGTNGIRVMPFTDPAEKVRRDGVGAWAFLYPGGKITVERMKLGGADVELDVVRVNKPDGTLKDAHYLWVRANDTVQCQEMDPTAAPSCAVLLAAYADGSLLTAVRGH